MRRGARQPGPLAVTTAVLLLVAVSATAEAQPRPATAQGPQRLTDAEFWRLSSGMSEPGGSFQSDNFTSNERTYPHIVAYLRETKRPGGVYLGVGPEQNFHYIAALRPQMAFLFDIRRQAVMQQLMYKALFELSADRAEFVSRLFSFPRAVALDSTSSIETIWNGYWHAFGDSALFTKNLTAVRDHLVKTRGMSLTVEDLRALTYVYEAFHRIGPSITYNGYGGRGGGQTRPSFAELTRLTDELDIPRSFLATEESYRFIRDMHLRNMIVPVVADFGGPTAIRAVGEYIKAQGHTVTAFYLSNVEQYLFGATGAAQRFYENVATLPLDSTSLFIRPLTGTQTIMRYAVVAPDGMTIPGAVAGRPPPASVGTQVCPILRFLQANRQGMIRSFANARACIGG